MSSNRRGRSLAEVMSPIDDELPAGQGEAAGSTKEETHRNAVPVVPVNILVAPEDRRRLRQLSLDTNLSLQKLGHEAWNLLLEKRGLPPLKPVSANVPSGRTIGRTRSSGS
jgi:hypothetical protein